MLETEGGPEMAAMVGLGTESIMKLINQSYETYKQNKKPNQKVVA